MKLTAEKLIVTPEEWATGFNITIKDETGQEVCVLDGYNVKPTTLPTQQFRQRCRDIRDALISAINRE